MSSTSGRTTLIILLILAVLATLCGFTSCVREPAELSENGDSEPAGSEEDAGGDQGGGEGNGPGATPGSGGSGAPEPELENPVTVDPVFGVFTGTPAGDMVAFGPSKAYRPTPAGPREASSWSTG